MKKYISIALVFLAAACNTIEQPQTDTSDAVIYIQATGEENLTKGSVDGDDATFTWNTGDRIAVYTKSGYVISRALSSADDGEASANFPFSSTGNYALVQADREDFAIFPASLVWDGNAIRTSSATNHDADNLTLTLPARYELSQVQNNVSPTPMIATNVENGALAFKALCPLLRLTVNNIPKQTKRIEFDFNGKKVQGEFTLTGIDMSAPVNYPAIETTAASDDNDIITVSMAGNTTWHDYLIFNLPVPAGTYGDITITAYDATSGGNAVLKLTKALKVSGAAWEPTRKSSGKMTASLPVFSLHVDPMTGHATKGTFAPGNLVLTVSNLSEGVPATVAWSFANNQYDIVGANGANMSINGNGTFSSAGSMDLFGWVGESSTVLTGELSQYGVSSSRIGSDYGNLSTDVLMRDWSNVLTSGDWTTPTLKDYYDLFKTRAGYSDKFGYAVVRNVKGLIILPDVFYDPLTNEVGGASSFVPTSIATVEYSGVDGGWELNHYNNEASWNAMEAAGAVFLPVSGFRTWSGDASAVNDLEKYGYYWTSTVYNNTMANKLSFGRSGGVFADSGSGTRCNAFAVRLVCYLE